MLKRYAMLSVVTLFSLALFGFTDSPNVCRDYPEQVKKIHTIAILAPDIAFYDTSLGGIREKKDDWSEQVNRNFIAALSQGLASRGFEAKVIAREGRLKEPADEIDSLFSAIVYSYRMHVQTGAATMLFPHKTAALDYSMGPLDDLLEGTQADALMIADGSGQAHSIMVPGGSVIWLTLVDRTGRLLWLENYTRQANILSNSWDIRNPGSVTALVEDKLKSMMTATTPAETPLRRNSRGMVTPQ